MKKEDEKFIKRCIKLAKISYKKGDNPFGALVVCNNKVIAESENKAYTNKSFDLSRHAEILALQKAAKKLNSFDLSKCTLYTICEPCPLCSFMIREYKIKRVVFAISSPHMGGYSKWKILKDQNLYQRFKPYFGKPPQITKGVLEDEAISFYKQIGWTIYT